MTTTLYGIPNCDQLSTFVAKLKSGQDSAQAT